MKKTILKSTKSIVIAAAICASLALGALSVAAGVDASNEPVVASHPSFIIGIW